MKLSGQIKKFFVLTKSEQRGVALLLILLFVIIVVNLLMPLFFRYQKYDLKDAEKEIEMFLQAHKSLEDSIKIEELQSRGELDYELAKRQLKPFVFDPNKLPEELWLKMGLTKKQIKIIKNYEARGGKFRKKEDLKKIYAISEAEYSILEPYIKIKSDFAGESENIFKRRIKTGKNISTDKKQLLPTELNGSDSATLAFNLNLSPWLAARIVKYRKLLGGFYDKNQLKEVYGINDNLYRKIENYLSVDTSKIEKLDINNASFKTIIRHPYIDYETAKKIVKGRKTRGGYNTLNEIKTDLEVPENIFNKISHYLYIRPQKNY